MLNHTFVNSMHVDGEERAGVFSRKKRKRVPEGGRGEASLRSDPGSELHLGGGGGEIKRANIIEGMTKKKDMLRAGRCCLRTSWQLDISAVATIFAFSS